jgi:hypothetical protein
MFLTEKYYSVILYKIYISIFNIFIDVVLIPLYKVANKKGKGKEFCFLFYEYTNNNRRFYAIKGVINLFLLDK